MQEEIARSPGSHSGDVLADARAWAERSGLAETVGQNPLMMFAGAVAVGYILGSMASGEGNSFAPVGALGRMAGTLGGQPRPMSTQDFAHRHTGTPQRFAPKGGGRTGFGM